jgi:hypothetical protein
MPFSFRRVLSALVMLFGLAYVQPASAAKILIFGDGFLGGFDTIIQDTLRQTLIGFGHTVIDQGSAALTDADFVGVDTAWHVGSTDPNFLAGTTLPALQNFLNAGGGLHLTGENPGFAATHNAALLDNLVNPFVTVPTIHQGGIHSDRVQISTGLHAEIADVLNSPNEISQALLDVDVAGELLGVDRENNLAEGDSPATAIGAIFGGRDMVVPGARLSIIMDVNWFLSDDSADIIENLQVFLEGETTVVAMPEPGTALLLASAGFLIVAYRRRKSA